MTGVLDEPPNPTEIHAATDSPTPVPSDNANLTAANAPIGVTFLSKGCPENFDTTAAAQEALFAACTSPIATIQISLSVNGVGFETVTIPDSYGG